MRSFLGQERGVFGPQLSDLFGFDSLSQAAADPLAAANGPLVARAKEALAIYDQLVPLIPSLPSSAQRDKAQSIVTTKWYNVSFLGLGAGKYDLNELAVRMRQYIAEPSGQFVRIGSDLKVSYSRKDRLESFVKGVQALQNYMKQFLVLPTKVVTSTAIIDQSAKSLLGRAVEATKKASSTRMPVDVAIARTLAQAAFDAANTTGDTMVQGDASALLAQIDQIAVLTVAPAAGSRQDGEEKGGVGLDTTTVVLLAATGVLLVTGVVLLSRK